MSLELLLIFKITPFEVRLSLRKNKIKIYFS